MSLLLSTLGFLQALDDEDIDIVKSKLNDQQFLKMLKLTRTAKKNVIKNILQSDDSDLHNTCIDEVFDCLSTEKIKYKFENEFNEVSFYLGDIYISIEYNTKNNTFEMSIYDDNNDEDDNDDNNEEDDNDDEQEESENESDKSDGPIHDDNNEKDENEEKKSDENSEYEKVFNFFTLVGKNEIKNFFSEIKKSDGLNNLDNLFSDLEYNIVKNYFDAFCDDLMITHEQLILVLIKYFLECIELCKNEKYNGYCQVD